MVVQDTVRSSPIVRERARHVQWANRVYGCTWWTSGSWWVVLFVGPLAERETNFPSNSSALLDVCAFVCRESEVWDDLMSL